MRSQITLLEKVICYLHLTWNPQTLCLRRANLVATVTKEKSHRILELGYTSKNHVGELP